MALTQPSPLSQHLPVRHLDQGNLMLSAQSNHQLLVSLLFARLVQHAHVRLSSIERFGGFAEPAGETVVDECVLQDAFESFEDGLGSRRCQLRDCAMAELGGFGGGMREGRMVKGVCGCMDGIIGGSKTYHLSIATGSRRIGGDFGGFRIFGRGR